MLKFALLLLVSFVVISPASAIDKSYLGEWSATDCGGEPALIITPTGISGTEYLCKTTKSSKSKKGWALIMKCGGEDGDYSYKTTFLLLKNGRLRETNADRTTEFRRCSGAQAEAPSTKAGTKAGNKLDTPWGRITQKQFANKCVECMNESQAMGRSVGGYCPPDCVDVFSTQMTCDNQGKCHVTP